MAPLKHRELTRPFCKQESGSLSFKMEGGIGVMCSLSKTWQQHFVNRKIEFKVG